MTEIKFYVSKEEGLEHRLAIVHRLIGHAVKRKLKIHIHTDSEETNIKLDDYLWNKDSVSFIPHGIIDSSISTTEDDLLNTNDASEIKQINISHNYEPLIGCDYLINLSNQRPTFFSRFSKVIYFLYKVKNKYMF